MTDLKMTAEEAVELFKRPVDFYDEPELKKALATLTALVEENAALKAELARLKPLTDLMKAVFGCRSTPQTDPQAGDVGQGGEK